MKMNLLFEFSNDPFLDDLSAQYARMALAVSMENRVTMIYRGDASVLAFHAQEVPIREVDYYNQERFLVEQEVDMYVVSEEMPEDAAVLKDCVKPISQQQLDEVYRQQDVIFRN
jgi:hypothetical protein